MFKHLKLTPLLFIFMIFSCATNEDAVRDIPEYSDALITKINSFISTGEYGRAIHLSRTVNDSRITSTEKKALEGLEAAYRLALSEERYFDAAENYKSLYAAGYASDRSLEEIYLKEVIKELDEGADAPALALYQQRIIKTSAIVNPTTGQLEKIFNAAVRNKNRMVIRYLAETYPELAGFKRTEIDEMAAYSPEKGEMISGTVTIWVDRGIRLERGLGFPDRVIGSGFYIDSRGYVLTNYHVISSEVDTEYEGFSRLYIKYDKNEEKIPATVVGWDASLDLALLKVIYTPEYIYNFPEIREYKPGESIFAIGSPGGLDKTITSGIVSAYGDRRLLPLGDTIQADVPVNSGNSGGPVVDAEGNLVGIVFAGIEQFEGVNFIIPARWVLNTISELYNGGRSRQSWLGFTVHESNEGLEIIYVMPGTSGFISGVEAGDRIVKIDGSEVKEIPDAQELILGKRPGTLLTLTVERDDKVLEYLLVAEERADIPMEKALELDSQKNLVSPFFGMQVERGNKDITGQEYIISKVYRGMTADETGLSVDDPFSIVSWDVDDENNVIFVGIRIKKRKAGFIESIIQLGSYIDINNTI